MSYLVATPRRCRRPLISADGPLIAPRLSLSPPPVTTISAPLKSNRIDEIVQEWFARFVDVDQQLLFELVTAANFMDIKPLLDLTCLAVSVLIKVRVPGMREGGGRPAHPSVPVPVAASRPVPSPLPPPLVLLPPPASRRASPPRRSGASSTSPTTSRRRRRTRRRRPPGREEDGRTRGGRTGARKRRRRAGGGRARDDRRAHKDLDRR